MEIIGIRIGNVVADMQDANKTRIKVTGIVILKNGKDMNFLLEDGRLAFTATSHGKTLPEIDRSTKQSINNLLIAYTAGLTQKGYFESEHTSDDACGSDCELEE